MGSEHEVSVNWSAVRKARAKRDEAIEQKIQLAICPQCGEKLWRKVVPVVEQWSWCKCLLSAAQEES